MKRARLCARLSRRYSGRCLVSLACRCSPPTCQPRPSPHSDLLVSRKRHRICLMFSLMHIIVLMTGLIISDDVYHRTVLQTSQTTAYDDFYHLTSCHEEDSLVYPPTAPQTLSSATIPLHPRTQPHLPLHHPSSKSCLVLVRRARP